MPACFPFGKKGQPKTEKQKHFGFLRSWKRTVVKETNQKEEVTASAPTTFFADFENEEVATTLFADFEEQEPGSEDLTQNEQTQTETNAHKLAAAGAQVDAVAKHTDAWTKELQNSVKNDNHKYAVFQGEKKLNGRHCVVFAGNDKYAGEFKNNQFHGLGLHTFANGESYDGEWRFGMQHGIGVKRWADGTAYKGFYRQDKRNGLGVCIYGDGTRYAGLWVDNHYDGVGKLVWPPDSKHTGSFAVMAGAGGKPQIMHGRSYIGHFLSGKKHGIGHHEFVDGSFYKGEYEEGLYHGTGTFRFANGDIYEGEWQKGFFHGKGQLWFGREEDVQDGEQREGYVGEFANGLRHGQGILHFRSGGRFEGQFNEGARKGIGLHIYPDGRQRRGEWWQFRDARDQLPSKVRDTLLLSHTLSEEAIFKLMFDEELPPLPDDDRQEEPLD
jgi:hypothetical protein